MSATTEREPNADEQPKHTHVVLRPIQAEGRNLQRGDLVDASEWKWRDQLVEQKAIRAMTAEEQEADAVIEPGPSEEEATAAAAEALEAEQRESDDQQRETRQAKRDDDEGPTGPTGGDPTMAGASGATGATGPTGARGRRTG